MSSNDVYATNNLISKLIEAVTEDIEALKTAKDETVIKISNGRLVGKWSGLSVYLFTLEDNLDPTEAEEDIEVQVGATRYPGRILKALGSEAAIGIGHDCGESVSEAGIIIDPQDFQVMSAKKIERQLSRLQEASEAIKEIDALTSKITNFSASLIFYREKIDSTREQITLQEAHALRLRKKIQQAEATSSIKRFFFSIKPETIQKDLVQAMMFVNDMKRLQNEREERVKGINQEKMDAEARIAQLKDRLLALANVAEQPESLPFESRSDFDSEIGKLLSRFGKIQKELGHR